MEKRYCYYVAYTMMVQDSKILNAPPAHVFGCRTVFLPDRLDNENEVKNLKDFIEDEVYTSNKRKVNVIILNWKELGSERNNETTEQ